MLPSFVTTSPLTTLIALVYMMKPSTAHSNSHRHAQLHARQEFPGLIQGCFSSPGGEMTNLGANNWQSSLACGNSCVSAGKPVMALHLSDCYCGTLLPSLSSRLDPTECNSPCDGWQDDTCGGTNAYSVWLTEITSDVARVGSSDPAPSSPSSSHTTSPSSSSSSPTAASPSTASPSTASPSTSKPTHPAPRPTHNAAGNGHNEPNPAPRPVRTTHKTIVKTTTAGVSATPDSQNGTVHSSSSNGSVIGIAVGVVAGVVAFAGLVAIILFYLRRRRRMKNAEKGHRRADSLNAFVASGARTPGSIPSSFGPLAGKVPAMTADDTRLDPRIMQETRRISGASFLADNEDYSRRILKVTNPDGT